MLVSKGGRRFHGTVGRIREGVVEITPIERGVSHRHASERDLLDVWHRDGAADGLVEVAKGQLSLAGRLDSSA